MRHRIIKTLPNAVLLCINLICIFGVNSSANAEDSDTNYDTLVKLQNVLRANRITYNASVATTGKCSIEIKYPGGKSTSIQFASVDLEVLHRVEVIDPYEGVLQHDGEYYLYRVYVRENPLCTGESCPKFKETLFSFDMLQNAFKFRTLLYGMARECKP